MTLFRKQKSSHQGFILMECLIGMILLTITISTSWSTIHHYSRWSASLIQWSDELMMSPLKIKEWIVNPGSLSTQITPISDGSLPMARLTLTNGKQLIFFTP